MFDKNKFLEHIKIDSNDFLNSFDDSAMHLSAWGHHYFCKEDGALLTYDRHDKKNHLCPICGKNYSEELYDQVWQYMYRNDALLTVYKLALLYKETSEKQYLNSIYTILDLYAKDYTSYKLHDKTGKVFETLDEATWGCGRLMPQGLNESLAFLRMLVGLQIIKNDLNQDKLLEYKKNIFDPLCDMVKPQIDKIHNIACWNNAIIGAVGLFYNDNELINYVFDNTYDINKQLKNGVTDDYFWFEGSIHYNLFTMEGLTYLQYFMNEYNYRNDYMETTLKNMYVAVFKYAFNNNELPNPNDGWPKVNLKTYSYQFALIAATLNDSELIYIYKEILENKNPRYPLPLSEPYYVGEVSLEDFYFGSKLNYNNIKTVEKPAVNFEASNYAIIKDGLTNVFVKYGHNGPSHAHPDKMNIEIMHNNTMLTRDLSNTGYGLDLCNQWHRVSASHNTVVINGVSHISTRRGVVKSFLGNEIEVSANNIYGNDEYIDIDKLTKSLNPDEVITHIMKQANISESMATELVKNNEQISSETNLLNVDYTRNLKVENNVITDKFLVEASEEVVIDNFIHFDLELINNFETEEADIVFNDNGYQHLKDIVKIKTDGKLKLTFKDYSYSVLIDTKNIEVLYAKTYSNPVIELRDTLILRKRDSNASFEVQWMLEGS